ncbi:coiled-coil domain-containing protein 113-like [Spodoptera litura]|uniref:Cilia- and flagella-associated protein 263 n=1 Tax=Spodoptera litura TaxID=69820 RepID=A0A9J7IJL9_SPOLT|nr:coiled-coil domain-containing protein 113-like [Spodoptera litura]
MSSVMQSAVRSSVMSQNSRSISGLVPDMDVLSDAELVKLVTELKDSLNVLVLENEILEKTIMRLEPSLMHGVYQALEYATRMSSNTSLNVGSYIKTQPSKFGIQETFLSPSRMLTSPSRVSTKRVESIAKLGTTIILGSGPRINVLERSELVSTEMEVLVTNLNKIRKKGAKQHALLKAQLEEIGLRVSEIDKASNLFHQEVLVEGWDKIAQRIPAEIWIRFMTEWVKISDSQIGKLRLRTSTLNTQFTKLKGQIKVKAELSESLRPVDFEKLKIENGECVKLIDHKLQQLGELKKLTGDANLNLTIHKKAMMEQNHYLNKVLTTIKNKAQSTVQLDKERDLIQVQADLLAQRLNEVRKVRLKYEVPNIMEYVQVKWVVTDLKHGIKMLENRKHIQQIALQSINRKLQTISEMVAQSEELENTQSSSDTTTTNTTSSSS